MDELSSKILDIITEKKKIHYLHLAVAMGTSSETARRRSIMLAAAYPKNLRYNKGTLELIKPLEIGDLTPEARLEAMSKTIEVQHKLLKKKEEKEKKLRNNHLPHLERAILEADIDKIRQELERLKKLYEEDASE